MKRLSMLLLAITLLFGFSLPQVSAEEKVNKETILQQAKEITKGTGIEMIDASKLPEGIKFLEFESIEQFKKAIQDKKFIRGNQVPGTNPISGNTPSDLSTLASSVGSIYWNDYDLWWSTFVQMGINFNYSYYYSNGQKRFSGVSNINSYSYGIDVTNWVQTNSSSSIIDGARTIQISINGYHLFGVSISGVPVGFKSPKSYTKYFYYNS